MQLPPSHTPHPINQLRPTLHAHCTCTCHPCVEVGAGPVSTVNPGLAGLVVVPGKTVIVGVVTEAGTVVPNIKDPAYAKYARNQRESRFKVEKK